MAIIFLLMAIFGWNHTLAGVINIGLLGLILSVLYVILWNLRRAQY